MNSTLNSIAAYEHAKALTHLPSRLVLSIFNNELVSVNCEGQSNRLL